MKMQYKKGAHWTSKSRAERRGKGVRGGSRIPLGGLDLWVRHVTRVWKRGAVKLRRISSAEPDSGCATLRQRARLAEVELEGSVLKDKLRRKPHGGVRA